MFIKSYSIKELLIENHQLRDINQMLSNKIIFLEELFELELADLNAELKQVKLL